MGDTEYQTVALTINRVQLRHIQALFDSNKWGMNMKVITDDDKLQLRATNLTHILPEVMEARCMTRDSAVCTVKVTRERKEAEEQRNPNEHDVELEQKILENDRGKPELCEDNEAKNKDLNPVVRKSKRLEQLTSKRQFFNDFDGSEEEIEPVRKRTRCKTRKFDRCKEKSKLSEQITNTMTRTNEMKIEPDILTNINNEPGVRLGMNDGQQAEDCDYTSIYSVSEKVNVKTTAKQTVKGRTFKCTYCARMFTTPDTLRLHAIKNHSEEEGLEYRCGDCSISFDSIQLLREHRRQTNHTTDLGWKRRQPFLDDLDLDSTDHCIVCGKQYRVKKALRRHCYRSHRDLMPMSECRMCYEQFPTVKKLHEHQHKENHCYWDRIKQPQLCNICGNTLKTMKTFKEHQQICTGTRNGERKYTCDICGLGFYTNSSCLNHRRYVHTSAKSTCAECGLQFKNTRTLGEHKWRQHKVGNRKHECSECHKMFFQKALLQVHLRTHTKEKPFQCALCDYKCSIKQNLPKHAMKKHKYLTVEQCKDYKIVLSDPASKSSEKHSVITAVCNVNITGKSFVIRNPNKRREAKMEIVENTDSNSTREAPETSLHTTFIGVYSPQAETVLGSGRQRSPADTENSAYHTHSKRDCVESAIELNSASPITTVVMAQKPPLTKIPIPTCIDRESSAKSLTQPGLNVDRKEV